MQLHERAGDTFTEDGLIVVMLGFQHMREARRAEGLPIGFQQSGLGLIEKENKKTNNKDLFHSGETGGFLTANLTSIT